MIHFCLIQSLGKPSIGAIAHLRRYLKNINLSTKIDYKIFTFNSNRSKDNLDSKISRVGEYTYGKTAIDICSMEEICTLLNNAYRGIDLLDGIELPVSQKATAYELIDYYTKNSNKLDTVMFSIFEPLLFLSLLTAIVIKKANPNVKIVFGGMHIQASENTTNLLSLIDYVDHVVVGDLAKGVEDYLNNNIKTLVHKSEDTELDLLHPAIYYKDEVESLAMASSHEVPGVWINGVKGCPNKCEYCVTNSVKFKKASVEAVVDSMKAIESLGVDNIVIHLNDNTTNYSKQRIHDLTDRMISKKMSVSTHSFMVLKHIDDEIANKLREARIKSLLMGYDGQIDKVRMLIGKNIHCLLFSIFCTPNETMSDFYKQISNATQILFVDHASMLMYTYDHFAGNKYFQQNTNLIHEMWPKQPFIEKVDEMNKIVCNTPRYYYRKTFDNNEYTRRRAEVLKVMGRLL